MFWVSFVSGRETMGFGTGCSRIGALLAVSGTVPILVGMGLLAKVRKTEEGQALVEFMLTLMLAMLIVAGIGTLFRKSLFKFWTSISKEVSGACPDCTPAPEIKNN
ncbi:MAG: hypothetical protein JNL01_05500 [Bdellovibrionales bacterium]|nr:hypothetical protein [Bdellovibrionales bacterium]